MNRGMTQCVRAVLMLYALAELLIASPGNCTLYDIGPLLERLEYAKTEASREQIREQIFDMLSVIPEETIQPALPDILAALNSDNEEVRLTASQILGFTAVTSPPSRRAMIAAAPVIVEHLDDSSRVVKKNLLRAIYYMVPHPPQQSEPYLLALAQAEDSGVQKLALGTLWRLAEVSPETVQAVVEMAQLGSPVRSKALEALGRFGVVTPTIMKLLLAALDAPELPTQKAGVVALGNLGPSAAEAVPRLQAMLASNTEQAEALRGSVRGALAKIETERGRATE